jgi:hypothetical protein
MRRTRQVTWGVHPTSVLQSKKFENFQAAVALNFAYYNFVKTHGTIRMTPVQAAGVENNAWTVSELVERCRE